MPRGDKPYRTVKGDANKLMKTKGIKSKSKATAYAKEMRSSERKANKSSTLHRWPDVKER